MHHHGGQQGQIRLEPVPDPFGQALAGRVLEAGDVVQIVMVQLVVERLEDCLLYTSRCV